MGLESYASSDTLDVRKRENGPESDASQTLIEPAPQGTWDRLFPFPDFIRIADGWRRNLDLIDVTPIKAPPVALESNESSHET